MSSQNVSRLALVTDAPALADDRELLDLETKALYLHAQLGPLGQIHGASEEATLAWLKENPRPKAGRELTQWKRRHRDAQKRFGSARAESEYHGAIDQHDACLRKAARLRATTIGGLQCKVRLLYLIEDGLPELEASIFRDILAISR